MADFPEYIHDVPVRYVLLDFLIFSFPFWKPEPGKFPFPFLPESVSFRQNIADRSVFFLLYPDLSEALITADDPVLFLPHRPPFLLFPSVKSPVLLFCIPAGVVILHPYMHPSPS